MEVLPTASRGDSSMSFTDVFKPDLGDCPRIPSSPHGAVDEPMADNDHASADEAFWMQFASGAVLQQLDDALGADALPFELEPEEEEEGDSLIEEADKLHAALDQQFGWAGKDLRKNKRQQLMRAST